MRAFSFSFWQKWLFLVGLLIALFGLMLAFFGQSPLFNAVFNQPLAAIFWPNQGIPKSVLPFQAWMYGLLGAIVSSWGIFIAFLAHFPFKAREQWAWICLAVGITLWFIVDTSFSIYYRAIFNAIANTVWFLLLALPLLFTKPYFFGNTTPDEAEVKGSSL